MGKRLIWEIIAGGAGSLLAPLLPVPDFIHRLAFAAAAFWVIDTLTGVAAARRLGRAITSRQFRKLAGNKSLSYFLVLAFGFVLSVLAQHYAPMVAALSAIVGSEGYSILENARALMQGSGESGKIFNRITGRMRKTLLVLTEEVPADQDSAPVEVKQGEEKTAE